MVVFIVVVMIDGGDGWLFLPKVRWETVTAVFLIIHNQRIA
jgi:hypothetical protein